MDSQMFFVHVAWMDPSVLDQVIPLLEVKDGKAIAVNLPGHGDPDGKSITIRKRKSE